MLGLPFIFPLIGRFHEDYFYSFARPALANMAQGYQMFVKEGLHIAYHSGQVIARLNQSGLRPLQFFHCSFFS